MIKFKFLALNYWDFFQKKLTQDFGIEKKILEKRKDQHTHTHKY